WAFTDAPQNTAGRMTVQARSGRSRMARISDALPLRGRRQLLERFVAGEELRQPALAADDDVQLLFRMPASETRQVAGRVAAARAHRLLRTVQLIAATVHACDVRHGVFSVWR